MPSAIQRFDEVASTATLDGLVRKYGVGMYPVVEVGTPSGLNSYICEDATHVYTCGAVIAAWQYGSTAQMLPDPSTARLCPCSSLVPP